MDVGTIHAWHHPQMASAPRLQGLETTPCRARIPPLGPQGKVSCLISSLQSTHSGNVQDAYPKLGLWTVQAQSTTPQLSDPKQGFWSCSEHRSKFLVV